MKKEDKLYYNNLSKEKLEYNFLNLIQQKNYPVIKYIIRNNELINLIDINNNNQQYLRVACHLGDMKMVKLLLESSEIKTHKRCFSIEDVKQLIHSPLTEACSSGNIKLVKYLLKNKDLYNSSIAEFNNLPIFISLYSGYFDIINFFIRSKLIKEIDMSIFGVEIVKRLMIQYVSNKDRENCLKLLKFFICEYETQNIKINEVIDEDFGSLLNMIAMLGNKDILNLFYIYFKDDNIKVNEAIISAFSTENISSLEFFLIDEKYMIPNELHNYKKSNVIRSFLDKLVLNKRLNKELEYSNIINKTTKI
jgi:ankyrin repeat protein